MDIFLFPILLFIVISPIVALLKSIGQINKNTNFWWITISESFALWIFPLIFFSYFAQTHSTVPCCDQPLEDFISDQHMIALLILIVFCNIFYYVSSLAKNLLPPLIEVLLMLFLCLGFLIACAIALQMKPNTTDGFLYDLAFILPILLFYGRQLYDNFVRLQKLIKENSWATEKWLVALAYKILNYPIWTQISFFVLLCLPFLCIFSGILLLFGQKPDALILAFTETYAGTFSQLKCDPNCHYDPHYLCTVASEGHSALVKPLRKGYRRGQWILVNRQLLVANAFEALFEKKLPKTHQIFRKCYDFLGTYIFRTHQTIRNIWVCDVVYILMKGFEYVFVLAIYACYSKPENHIGRQYLP